MSKYRITKFSDITNKLITLIKDILFHSISLNACLHYNYGRLMHRNWGDDINMYLLERIWKKPLSYLCTSVIASRKQKINYVCIGSTLAMLSNENSIVWGAGVIDETEKLKAYPKKILAVRGPKTRQWLLDRGVQCPEIYGDPAMLLAEIYTPKPIGKRYKLGIIPHYDDFNHPSLISLKGNSDVLFIHMEGYKDWLRIIDEIASCDYIASSSLHGLIMAEAYNIPNLWIEISGKLMGGHFKFHDYFQSMHVDREMPYIIRTDTTMEDILSTKSSYMKGYIDLTPLKNASPFPLHLNKI